MNQEMIEAVKDIAKEKNIDRDDLGDILKEIFNMMIKKKYITTDNFDVIVNIDKGEIEIYKEMIVVKEIEDPDFEITLEKAQKIEPDIEIGDDYVEIVDIESFGRRAIISAKQNLSQKLKEAEKEVIFAEYQKRVGEIVIGDVTQINREEIVIGLDKTEVILPRSEQISNERYRRGDSIRAIIKAVERGSRGPEIIVSRRDPGFLIHLFEVEVPEIYDGIIEVRGIIREAGERTKIAVESNDKRIDPVGACVGMKGIRIQAIVKELNNEKIDIISFSSDANLFVSRAVSPCKPKFVEIDHEAKKAKVIVEEDQLRHVQGMKGSQNIRLASELTGYSIEVIHDAELKKADDDTIDVMHVEGISDKIKQKLVTSGYETAEDILDAGVEKLTTVPGVGTKTAEKILAIMNSFYEEDNA